MKKLNLGGIVFAAALLAGPALAADLPVQSPVYKAPVIAPVYNWTGFYVGVNGGGSWGRSSTDLVLGEPRRSGVVETAIGSTSQAMNGGLGGFQAGYNFETGAYVLGLESDIQITSQKGDGQLADTLTIPQVCLAPCTPPPPLVTTGMLDYAQRLPWFGTFRGRVGVTPSDRWLVYATGGLAFGEIKTDANFTVPPTGGACLAPCTPTPPGSAAGSFSQTKVGWVVGAGVEAALGGGWTGKLEYLYMDLGGFDNVFASTVPNFSGTFLASSRVTDNIVRVGLNYRFGSAVVAKY
ncbi:MAG: porin family protein [Bradyrhizobium sp.]|uniref:outer membrane protein n=1 Tax=Bradyrhizobium sp. TaxID=376 RepID=UPI0012190F94|nr:outer membrane protein [Bradyrhizobium sp.]THD47767.1 MAG: porin family protein [Bradyrhizobium sp.]